MYDTVGNIIIVSNLPYDNTHFVSAGCSYLEVIRTRCIVRTASFVTLAHARQNVCKSAWMDQTGGNRQTNYKLKDSSTRTSSLFMICVPFLEDTQLLN